MTDGKLPPPPYTPLVQWRTHGGDRELHGPTPGECGGQCRAHPARPPVGEVAVHASVRPDHPPHRILANADAAGVNDFGGPAEPHFPPAFPRARAPVDPLPIESVALVLRADLDQGFLPDA